MGLTGQNYTSCSYFFFFQGQASHDATLHSQAFESANQILGKAMAKVKYEDDERHLPKSAASFDR
jgi:hypothetical protein